jgi:hypothetical protein
MSSQEAVHVFPSTVTPNWGKGTLDLGSFIGSAVAGHRAGYKPAHVMERGCG